MSYGLTILILKNRYIKVLCNMMICKFTIDVIDSMKFLELMVEKSLSWHSSIHPLSKKLGSSSFALRSVSKELIACQLPEQSPICSI